MSNIDISGATITGNKGGAIVGNVSGKNITIEVDGAVKIVDMVDGKQLNVRDKRECDE